jgi:hypothetical protein
MMILSVRFPTFSSERFPPGGFLRMPAMQQMRIIWRAISASSQVFARTECTSLIAMAKKPDTYKIETSCGLVEPSRITRISSWSQSFQAAFLEFHSQRRRDCLSSPNERTCTCVGGRGAGRGRKR